jgi:GTP cyclohydrolase I
VLDAEHSCMTLRGARKESSRMVTLASAGIFQADASARRDVLDLLGAGASAGRSGRAR